MNWVLYISNAFFHLLKNIKKEIRPILKSEKVSKEYKTELKSYFQKIRDIFDTYVEEIALERLEKLLNEFNQIPKVLQKIIKNKIIPDFQRLTIHEKPKYTTNNQLQRKLLPTNPTRQFKKKIQNNKRNKQPSTKKNGKLDQKTHKKYLTPKNFTDPTNKKISFSW